MKVVMSGSVMCQNGNKGLQVYHVRQCLQARRLLLVRIMLGDCARDANVSL